MRLRMLLEPSCYMQMLRPDQTAAVMGLFLCIAAGSPGWLQDGLLAYHCLLSMAWAEAPSQSLQFWLM